MAITVKSITLWRKEIDNVPGALAAALEPLAGAKADLKVVMGYRYTGDPNKAAVELYPVAGKKAVAVATGLGLTACATPSLLVEGQNKPGIGAAFSRALADAGINMSFLLAQTVGRKFSAVFGFDTADDAKKAVGLLKKAAGKK